MKTEQHQSMTGRLKQADDTRNKVRPAKSRPARRHYPRKPTTAQIERFEKLRARLMGAED